MQSLLASTAEPQKMLSGQAEKAPKPKKKSIETSDISLILHTKTAENFFKQSWSYESSGLRRFARTMQLLWQAAKAGDPYAEWHLIQIYDQIGLLQESFKQFEQDYQTYLSQIRGFEIALTTSEQPFRFLLRFGNPFAYLGAQLFADLDYALRQSYALKKVGFLLPIEQLPHKLMTKIRHLFTQGKTWQYTGITREDILQHNQKAQQAEEKMGKLPKVILNKEVQFGLLPKAAVRQVA